MQRRAKTSTKPLLTSEMIQLSGVEGLLVYGMLMLAGETDKAVKMLKEYGVKIPEDVEVPKELIESTRNFNLLDGIQYFRGDHDLQENGDPSL